MRLRRAAKGIVRKGKKACESAQRTLTILLQRHWRAVFATGAGEQKSKESISENLHRSRSAEEESWYCMIRWMARREN